MFHWLHVIDMTPDLIISTLHPLRGLGIGQRGRLLTWTNRSGIRDAVVALGTNHLLHKIPPLSPASQGAACMNNTFCLGVFMFLIFFRSLAWEFSAETITILLVQVSEPVGS